MSYITFSTLGESGGMCSQLQSYASLLAVAKANNKEIVFAKSMFDKGCGIKIFDLLNITPNIKPDSFFAIFPILLNTIFIGFTATLMIILLAFFFRYPLHFDFLVSGTDTKNG